MQSNKKTNDSAKQNLLISDVPKKTKKRTSAKPNSISKKIAADEPKLLDSSKNKLPLQGYLIDSPTQARFILDEHLGTGGVCEVFKALDLRRVEWGDTNPYVAIKKLIPKLMHDTKAQACLIQEFYTVRHLNHQGIIRFFDIHKEPWGMCCSMELLQGTSLKNYIIENPLGKGKLAYNIILNLLYAVEFIHSKNIAHGDIKPANIFLEANDKIVLLDFNVASVGDQDDNSTFAKRIFQAKNPHAHCSLYSSPEQVSTGIVSLNADIFSVACCIYQLFQGSHPFDSIAPSFPMHRIIFPKKPQYMPYCQWYILKLAMNHKADKRPCAKTMIKCFRQPFGSFFTIIYFCKTSMDTMHKFTLKTFTKLKQLLEKD